MNETGVSPAIPCSGPCRKRFRLADTTPVVSGRVADVLLTIDFAESGLAWFCPDCRQNGEAIDFPQDPLPPELWLMVFQHLNGSTMLSVRLTCARWRDIVDGNRCTRDKLCAYFKEVTLDWHFAPENLIRTSQVQYYKSEINGIGAWWSWFGPGLTELILCVCEIKLHALFGMLRETVNLVKLTLEDMDYLETDEKVTVDYRLEKLETLYCDEIFDAFGLMFPRLSELSTPDVLEAKQRETVCQMLYTAQDTLKDLTCTLTPSMLEQMIEMCHLRLTTIENRSHDLDAVVMLSQVQPSIEDLTVGATSSVIFEVALNLARLRKVYVWIKHEPETPFFIPAFLEKAPNVTSVTLAGTDRYLVNFGIVNAPYLKYLTLNSVTLDGSTFRAFLSSCSNLEELDLESSTLHSWVDIFTVNFKSLQRINLCLTDSLYGDDQDLALTVNSVTSLDIYHCNVSTKLLLQLFSNRFSHLSKLQLSAMESVDDEVIRTALCQPKLDDLLLLSCANLTDASVEAILNCSTLRKLTVWNCEGISEEGQRKIREFKKTL